MGHCTLCEQFHPFTLTGQFKCEGCQTEPKLATSTIVKAIVVPVLIVVPGALLLEPLIGKGGIIALGLIVGNTLPFILLSSGERGRWTLSAGASFPAGWATK